MAKQIKKIDQSKLISLLVFVLVVGMVSGFGLHSISSSSAAPRPKGGYGNGSCYASPNPTTTYSTFTVNMSGMPANSIVSYITTDKAGSGWSSVSTDALGNAHAPDPYTAYAGTSTITVSSTGGHKATTLATCTVDIK